MKSPLLCLVSELDNLSFSREKKYIFLRHFFARTWLQTQQLSTDFIPDISLEFLPLPPPFTHLLTTIPVGPEGIKNALTPEIIGLINERYAIEKSARPGIFYTPFETARQLAQETLLAWLKLHHFLPDTARTIDLACLTRKDRQRLSHALTQLTVCDPACGAGGLLIPFWLELAAWRHALTPTEDYATLLHDIAARNLYGIDINPHAIEDLRLRMSLTLAAHGKKLPTSLHFHVADALAGNPSQAWRQHFPDVFSNGGFDIYLANPPYIGQKNHKEIFTALRQNPHWKKWLTPKSDLLYLFFHLAFDVLAKDGVAGLLTTSYFAQAAAAKPLRLRLKQQADILRLIDFGEEKLFTRAKGQHNLITIFTPTQMAKTPENLFFGSHVFLSTRSIPADINTALCKMAATSTRLKDCAHISNGLMTGCDKAFILSADEIDTLSPNTNERKKLKPFFKNSDILPYVCAQIPRLYLIDLFYPADRDIDLQQYPHFAIHLAKFKEKLLARKQNNNGIQNAIKQGKYWFGSVRRKLNFDDDKIVIPHRAARNIAAYAPREWYASSDVYFISSPRGKITLWYLLALLNSKPYYAWLFYKGKRKGKLLELYSQPLGEIPVPSASAQTQKTIEQLAQRIYAKKCQNADADITAEQHQLDKLICALFRFNKQETCALLTFQA